MRTRAAAVIVLLVCALTSGTHLSAAEAAGSDAISTAPPLPFMLTHTGGANDVDTSQIVDPNDPDALRWHEAGKPGVEYWAIPLQAHQLMSLVLTHEQGAGDTRACILPWWTSDKNLVDTGCLIGAIARPGVLGGLTYSPQRDATVYLAVWDESCCELDDWEYTVTVRTPTDTTLILDAPTKRARPGANVTVDGRLGNVVEPQVVTIQRQKWWRTKSWFKAFRTVTTDASGAFHFTYRVPKNAQHGPAFLAVYEGSPGPIGYERSVSNAIYFKLKARR